MPTSTVLNSHRRNKADTKSSQPSNGTANGKTSSAAANRLLGYETDHLAEAHDDDQRRGHDGGVDRLAASSHDERDCDHDDLPGAAGAPEVDGREVQIEAWNIGELKEHPLQPTYFPDESEQADAELAADMDANGQQLAIDILPDGTILGGHRRVRAAKSLGWTLIDVVVHHELADDEAAAEAQFIGDNYNRRQLTDLQRARCAKRRVELARQGKVTLPKECSELKKTRDKIGWLMGKSGRHAERYLKVLEAPIEVQHACDAGHLSLVDGARVAGFCEEKQQQMAAELRERGLLNAKAIFDGLRESRAAQRRGAESFWCELRRVLVVAVKELSGNVDKLLWLDEDDLELIQQAQELLEELEVRAIERVDQQVEEERWEMGDSDHQERIADVQRPVDMMSTDGNDGPVDTMSPVVDSP